MLRHQFYYKEICRDFDLEPLENTLALLNKHRMRVISHPDQLIVVGEVDANGKPLYPIYPGTPLFFSLKLRNKDFLKVTDYKYLPKTGLLTFSNEDGKKILRTSTTPLLSRKSDIFTVRDGIEGESFLLSHRPWAGVQNSGFQITGLEGVSAPLSYDPSANMLLLDTRNQEGAQFSVEYPVTLPLGHEVFGLITLLKNESLPMNGGLPTEFTLTFQAIEQVWKYYVITENTEDVYEIKDKSNQVQFQVLELVKNNVSNVSEALVAQYPAGKVSLFQSTTRVPLHEMGLRGIQLLKNGNPVLANLPSIASQNEDFRIIDVTKISSDL